MSETANLWTLLRQGLRWWMLPVVGIFLLLIALLAWMQGAQGFLPWAYTVF